MRLLGPIILIQLALAAPASAQTMFDADPQTDDPFVLAQLAERDGDAVILERLGSTTPLVQRLLAIRVAPLLEVPELAIVRLAELAAGVDPDEAPAAGYALLQIVRRLGLEPWRLSTYEVMAVDLVPARAPLTRLAEDTLARGDLRRIATLVLDLFDQIGIGATETDSETAQ